MRLVFGKLKGTFPKCDEQTFNFCIMRRGGIQRFRGFPGSGCPGGQGSRRQSGQGRQGEIPLGKEPEERPEAVGGNGASHRSSLHGNVLVRLLRQAGKGSPFQEGIQAGHGWRSHRRQIRIQQFGFQQVEGSQDVQDHGRSGHGRGGCGRQGTGAHGLCSRTHSCPVR